MSVFKRFNGSTWETIGPGVTSARFDTINNMIAPQYDSSQTYAVGDYVVQSDKLYRCKTAITVAETWNSSHWTEITVGTELGEVKSTFKQEDSITGNVIFKNQSVSRDTILFDSYTAFVGDVIVYSYDYERSTACYIELRNSSHQVLAYYGKSSSGTGETNFFGSFIIPSNFSYAILRSNDTEAVASFHYLNCIRNTENAINKDFDSTDKNIGDIITENETISVNTRLFELGDVFPGDSVVYSFDYAQNTTCFIELRDKNNNELAYYGKSTVYMKETVYHGIFRIPDNFSYAILRSNDGSATAYFSIIGKISNINNFSRRNIPSYNLIDFVERGSYSGTGQYADSLTTLRLPILELYKISISLTLPTGITLEVIEFDKLGESYTKYSGKMSGYVSYQSTKKYQCLIFEKQGATLNKSDLDEVTIEFSYILGDLSGASVLEATGDTADRSNDISTILFSNKVVTLGAGDFYVSSAITVPTGCTIKGQGDNTKIITTSSLSSVLSLTSECTIENLKIIGPQTSTPESLGSYHAISILQQNSNNRINNISIEQFSGAGIYAIQTYNNAHNSNVIHNCRFNKCGCGIYIGTRAEAFAVSDCVVLNSYIGVHCIGGNNRVIGCLIRGCTYGFDMTSSSTSDNDGHSTFVGLVIIHNTHAIKIDTIEYGVLFNGCTIFYGDIVISASSGIIFNGCEIGNITAINGTGSNGVRMMNCIFSDMQPSVVTNVALAGCTKLNGDAFGT